MFCEESAGGSARKAAGGTGRPSGMSSRAGELANPASDGGSGRAGKPAWEQTGQSLRSERGRMRHAPPRGRPCASSCRHGGSPPSCARRARSPASPPSRCPPQPPPPAQQNHERPRPRTQPPQHRCYCSSSSCASSCASFSRFHQAQPRPSPPSRRAHATRGGSSGCASWRRRGRRTRDGGRPEGGLSCCGAGGASRCRTGGTRRGGRRSWGACKRSGRLWTRGVSTGGKEEGAKVLTVVRLLVALEMRLLLEALAAARVLALEGPDVGSLGRVLLQDVRAELVVLAESRVALVALPAQGESVRLTPRQMVIELALYVLPPLRWTTSTCLLRC